MKRPNRINQQYIMQIKSKCFNKIESLMEEGFDRITSSQEKYYEVENYIKEAKKEIEKYKSKKP